MLDPLAIERLERKAGDGPILIALSGGGDSVALLHLMAERFGPSRLTACVIDHALREGSRTDAERAAAFAAAIGVDAKIETLTWPSANRAHEAARRLRYAALCRFARSIGARVIVTAHTRDDQAETVLLRAARGSGLRGLAGMRAFSPAPIWPEGRALWLARPLLSARRHALREVLSARGARWIEDPANDNQIYARVRARRALAAMEAGGLDPMRLAAIAERLQPHVGALDAQAAALIANAVRFENEEIVLHREQRRGDTAVKQRALEALLMAASGAERGPAPAQIEDLAHSLDDPDFLASTLGGAWLQKRGAHILIRRDAGALTGRADGVPPMRPALLPAGEETIWDGRVALTAGEPGWSVVFDGRAPLLQRGEERRPLAAASPHWLLRERVQHVLGTD